MTRAFKQGFNDMLLKIAEETEDPAISKLEDVAAQPKLKTVPITEVPAWTKYVPWRTSWDDITDKEYDFNRKIWDHNWAVDDAQAELDREKVLSENEDEALRALERSEPHSEVLPWGLGPLLRSNLKTSSPFLISDEDLQAKDYQGVGGGWAVGGYAPHGAILDDALNGDEYFTKNPKVWDRSARAFTPVGTNIVNAFQKYWNAHESGPATNTTRRINWDLLDHQTGKKTSPFSLSRTPDGDGEVFVEDWEDL